MTTTILRLPWITLMIVALLCPGASTAQEEASPPPDANAEEAEVAVSDSTSSPLAAEAERLLEDLEQRRSEYRALLAREESLSGEEFLVARLQRHQHLLGVMRDIERLVENIAQQQREGIDTPRGRRRTRAILRDIDQNIGSFLDLRQDETDKLRAQLENLSGEEARSTRELIRENEEGIDEIFRFAVSHLDHLAVLGLSDGVARATLVDRLPRRAETVAGRLQLLRVRLNGLREDKRGTEKNPDLDAAIRTAQEQLTATASSMWIIADLMDDLGMSTATYRQVLIRSTGEITRDVLNWEVAAGLLDSAWQGVREWGERRGPTALTKLGIFLAIVAVFWVLGTGLRMLLAHTLRTSAAVSELARRTLINLVRRLTVIAGILFALTQMGIEVTALLAGVGIVGFIVGFALQETLANFAAGAMILTYRPFDVGDVVEAGGVFGTVHTNTLVSTTILTFDNETLVVPNSKIWGSVIRNDTAQVIRRVDLRIPLSHDVEVERAEALFASILNEHDKVLDDPKPLICVDKLTETAVEFIVRPWTPREHYWDVRWALTRSIKLGLEREGIPLAVPGRRVTIEDQADQA